MLLEADLRNGEAALAKHLWLRKIIAEIDDKTIKKMGYWYQAKLNILKKRQDELKEELINAKDSEDAERIRKKHKESYENIEEVICKKQEFISAFSHLGSPQEVLDLINRIYNFAHVVIAGQNSQKPSEKIDYMVEDVYEENDSRITVNRKLDHEDDVHLIQLLTPSQLVEKKEHDIEEKDKEKKDKEEKLLSVKKYLVLDLILLEMS